MMVDMAPRSALILILPVGFSMATSWGSPIQGPWLVLIWIAAAIWFVLMWSVHVKAGSAMGERLRKLDMVIRYGVMVGYVRHRPELLADRCALRTEVAGHQGLPVRRALLRWALHCA